MPERGHLSLKGFNRPDKACDSGRNPRSRNHTIRLEGRWSTTQSGGEKYGADLKDRDIIPEVCAAGGWPADGLMIGRKMPHQKGAAAGECRGKQGVWAESELQRMKYPLNQLHHFCPLLPETSSNFPIASVSTASTSGAT